MRLDLRVRPQPMDAIRMTPANCRLTELEDVIRRNIDAAAENYIKVGTALREINDSGLYLATHTTFEAYCHDKWGMSRPRAYQLIDAEKTVSTICRHDESLPLPATEGVARELKGSPEEKVTAWRETVKRHPKPTAAQTRKVVEELRPKAAEEPKARSRRRQRDDDGEQVWLNDEVLGWVKEQQRLGRTREQIRRDSELDRNGWPLGSKAHLPQNGVDRCSAIFAYLARRPEPPSAEKPPTRPPKGAAKRVREIGKKRHSTPVLELMYRINQLTSVLEEVDVREEKLDTEGYVADRLRDLWDILTLHMDWVESTLQDINAVLGKADLIIKRDKLRVMAEQGTPPEQEVAKRLLPKVERRIEERDALAAG